jgi:hypothetical protein
MPEVFRYLVQKDRGSDLPSVQDRYKLNDLVCRPVIRDELTNTFNVFESRDEFLAWYEAVPEKNRCCHEVIFGKLPQRLKFDVDAPSHKLDALPDGTLEAALQEAADALACNAASGRVESDLDDYFAALLADDAPLADDDPLAILLGEAPSEIPRGNAAIEASCEAPSEAPRDNAAIEAARTAKIHAVIGLLIEAILDELYVAYYGIEDLLPTRGDLVVTDSSGPTANGTKYSFHVLVLPYFVADNEEAREFTARVLERLPPPVRTFIDPDVNKKTQNFRLAGSAKPGTGRYKRATREAAQAFGTAADVPLRDLFVTAPSGGRVLPRVYTEVELTLPQAPKRACRKLGPQDVVVQTALEIAKRAGITTGHTFSEARGSLLCFVRDAPSHCRICGETHHKDNSLMVSIDPIEGGHDGAWPGTGAVACRVLEHCRQARGRSLTIGEATFRAEDLRGTEGHQRVRGRAPPEAAKSPPLGLHKQITERVTAIREGRVNPHDALASEFERLPEAQKTVYAEEAMRPYELTPTLAVLAQMKLGKTKKLRAYLTEHFPVDGLETPVIRILTFRQTFSNSISKDFPDFTLYSSVTGDLDHVRHPRLIVQVESLHRLSLGGGAPPVPVDLLVLDEAESILAQFNSGLHKHFNSAFAAFQWMMQTARHVICMDANLSDRTYRTLERLRPAHPPHFHWNRFARAADDVYHFTADQGAWLGRLYATLRSGARVVLPTNSLTEARAYEEAVRREFPAKSVMLYSSEMAPSEKARHFGDVHSYWGSLDVLIFTPTCSAGVSFELEHFDTLFGYFCDVSCDVETCRQMLARVRNLRTREHYICICATGATLPTTTEAITRLIRDKRAGLYRGVEDVALQFEYGADGEIRFYESNYYHLWLETVRINNLSRNDFARRFIDQVADTGARVGALDASEPEAGAALLLAHRETRNALSTARCEVIAAAADLTPDEAASVRDALCSGGGQQDVAPELRLAYEKYQLCEAYAWHGRPLSAAFVSDYQGFGARRVYRNLCRITEGATVLESLQRMRRQEADHYDYVMESRMGAFGHLNESRDLLRDKMTYVFQAHFIAIWFLRICGFASITDRGRIHEELLEARLRSAIPALKRAADGVAFEFEIPRPNLERLSRELDRARFLASMLRTINAVLRAMYGLQVRRVAKSAGGGAYYLGHNAVGKLFVFAQNAEPDDTPGGPRPHIPSNLEEPPANEHDRVNLFLAAAYYAAADDNDAEDAMDGDTEDAIAATAAAEDDAAENVTVRDLDLDDFLSCAFEEFTARTDDAANN